DDPKERNLLFVRDFTSMTSSVMLYFFAQKALLKHLTRLGWEESAKRRFFTHVPSQILSLTLSATVGPLFSQWIEKRLKALHAPQKGETPSNTPRTNPSSSPTEKLCQGVSAITGISVLLNAKKQMLKMVQDAPKTVQKHLAAQSQTLQKKLVTMSYTELPVWVLATELGALSADAVYHILHPQAHERHTKPTLAPPSPPVAHPSKELHG
ncbi:MAG: hypothetical protein ACKO37_09390, partial [Vampirovibrionales bacterium]